MAPNAPRALVRKVFALYNEGGVGGKHQRSQRLAVRSQRLAVSSFITWRPITTTDDLTAADLAAIANTLEYWKACGEIEYRCRRIAGSLTVPAKTEAGQR